MRGNSKQKSCVGHMYNILTFTVEPNTVHQAYFVQILNKTNLHLEKKLTRYCTEDSMLSTGRLLKVCLDNGVARCHSSEIHSCALKICHSECTSETITEDVPLGKCFEMHTS